MNELKILFSIYVKLKQRKELLLIVVFHLTVEM